MRNILKLATFAECRNIQGLSPHDECQMIRMGKGIQWITASLPYMVSVGKVSYSIFFFGRTCIRVLRNRKRGAQYLSAHII